jgi:alpha-tubulin suppressor-like RCC1 family protein
MPRALGTRLGQRLRQVTIYRRKPNTNWKTTDSSYRLLTNISAWGTSNSTSQRDSSHKTFKFLLVSGCFAFFTGSALCLEQLKSSWIQLQEEKRNDILKAAVENGTLLTTFGLNLIGQLGQGHERPADRPYPVEALAGKQIVYVAAGDSCTAAISRQGDLYTWGSGEYGKLGHSDDSNENLPRLVESLKGKNIVKVSVGGNHMSAIDKDGNLYCWGRAACAGFGGLEHVYTPTLIQGDLSREKVISVSCGRSHTAAVTESGQVWTWGYGYEGELGHGEKSSQLQPKRVESLNKVVDVACGRDFTIFVCEDGLYSCGADDYGQLGLGRSHGERFVQTPRSLSGTGLSEIVAISAGDYHVCAIGRDGLVYTWGLGREGQLGHGEKADCSLAKPVDGLRNFEVIQVACGGGHTAAVTRDGVLYTWGRGRDGQLGRGGELESIASYRTSPVQVTSLPAGTVLQVSLGSDHSAVLCRDMKNKNS